MHLHIEYARIANQFFTAFHQQFKCFNHECQMPVAHSVLNRLFSMSVPTSCSNTRSKSVAKWYKLSYQWTREASHSVSQTKWSFIFALRWPAL